MTIYYMKTATCGTIIKASIWAGDFKEEGFSNLDILKHVHKISHKKLFDVNGTRVKFELKVNDL